MAQRRLFIGFSTQDMQGQRGWTVYDVELVKRDLLNQFYTRVGERLMMPTYGTIIWDKLFEPFTDANQQAIIADVQRIVKSDPRVELTAINVSTSENGIMVSMDLNYVPWNAIGTFSIDFDRRSLEG